MDVLTTATRQDVAFAVGTNDTFTDVVVSTVICEITGFVGAGEGVGVGGTAGVANSVGGKDGALNPSGP